MPPPQDSNDYTPPPQDFNDYLAYTEGQRQLRAELGDDPAQQSDAARQQEIAAQQALQNAQDDILRHEPVWHVHPDIYWREQEEIDSILFYIEEDKTWWEFKEARQCPFRPETITRHAIHFLPDHVVLTRDGIFLFHRTTRELAEEMLHKYHTYQTDSVRCIRVNIPRHMDP